MLGYEPDGDSVRFITDDATHYDALKRSDRIRPSPRDGSVQLRFEGVDAPELHYSTRPLNLRLLSRDENDRVLLQDTTEVHLSDLIQQRNEHIAFQADLLDLTFVEK
jgi:hypothetical protein